MLSYWPRAQSVVRQLLRDGVIPKPSWVVGSCVHQFAGLAGLSLAREYRVPFIYEVRDLWPETLTSVGHWSPYSPPVVLSRQLSRYLYRKADHIVTLLPGSEDTIISYGVPRERISLIPNGVDLRWASDATPMRPCGTEGKFLVTYAGSHGRANVLDQLLSAAKILQVAGHSEVHFLFVGSGPEKEPLRARAIAESILNVSFLDPMPKKNIYSVLNASDVFFLGAPPVELSNKGMSQNKLMDYFAVGRPIVMACDSAINPVTESGGGIVVPSDSPQELADTFLHLLQMSQDERSAMGRRGQEYVRQHHSVEHLADLWEGVFERLGEGMER
jgi:glycosyltransferase involved in cell wall biosynthesis